MLSYPEDSVLYAPADYDVNKIGFILISESGKNALKSSLEKKAKQKQNASKPGGIHTKYCCRICERSYMSSSNLARHMRIIHQSIFSCANCKMEFSGERASMRFHLHQCADVGKAVQYNCDFCGHTATSRENLIWHLELHRKLDIEIDDIFV